MKYLRFYGNSDDTFGEYGVTDDDYDNCASGKPIAYKVSASDGELIVVGQYAPRPTDSGCWMIGVMLVEDKPLPPWIITFESQHEYSHALAIEAPDDVKVECINSRKKAE